MIGAMRLAWRLQRSEILFVVVACVALAAVSVWLTLDMRSILARCGTASATTACDVIFAFQETHGGAVGTVQTLVGYVPFVVGLVLGVPIVTREVEHRTALLAWPLSRSRLRWLAWRTWPVLLVGVAMVAQLGVAADGLARAYFPHSDIGFVAYESRGFPLVMRTALVLAAGLVIGAVLGRLLPALLVGIGASAALVVGLATALPQWAPATVLENIETDPAAMIGARLHTAIHYRLPSGEIVSADEGEMLAETVYQAALPGEPDPALLPEMIITGIAADRYPDVVIRESAVTGAGVVLLTGLAAFVVQRRRPE